MKKKLKFIFFVSLLFILIPLKNVYAETPDSFISDSFPRPNFIFNTTYSSDNIIGNNFVIDNIEISSGDYRTFYNIKIIPYYEENQGFLTVNTENENFIKILKPGDIYSFGNVSFKINRNFDFTKGPYLFILYSTDPSINAERVFSMDLGGFGIFSKEKVQKIQPDAIVNISYCQQPLCINNYDLTKEISKNYESGNGTFLIETVTGNGCLSGYSMKIKYTEKDGSNPTQIIIEGRLIQHPKIYEKVTLDIKNYNIKVLSNDEVEVSVQFKLNSNENMLLSGIFINYDKEFQNIENLMLNNEPVVLNAHQDIFICPLGGQCCTNKAGTKIMEIKGASIQTSFLTNQDYNLKFVIKNALIDVGDTQSNGKISVYFPTSKIILRDVSIEIPKEFKGNSRLNIIKSKSLWDEELQVPILKIGIPETYIESFQDLENKGDNILKLKSVSSKSFVFEESSLLSFDISIKKYDLTAKKWFGLLIFLTFLAIVDWGAKVRKDKYMIFIWTISGFLSLTTLFIGILNKDYIIYLYTYKKLALLSLVGFPLLFTFLFYKYLIKKAFWEKYFLNK